MALLVAAIGLRSSWSQRGLLLIDRRRPLVHLLDRARNRGFGSLRLSIFSTPSLLIAIAAMLGVRR